MSNTSIRSTSFTDQSLVPDPHPVFDYLRSPNPVLCSPTTTSFRGHLMGIGQRVLQRPRTRFPISLALGGPLPPFFAVLRSEGSEIRTSAQRSMLTEVSSQ